MLENRNNYILISNNYFSKAANLQDWVAHAKLLPRGEIPHGEQDMLLCLDVTHSGCSGWSCALMWSQWEEGLALQWNSSNGLFLDSLPKGFQALCSTLGLFMLEFKLWDFDNSWQMKISADIKWSYLFPCSYAEMTMEEMRSVFHWISLFHG